jgi:hypothetical protein
MRMISSSSFTVRCDHWAAGGAYILHRSGDGFVLCSEEAFLAVLWRALRDAGLTAILVGSGDAAVQGGAPVKEARWLPAVAGAGAAWSLSDELQLVPPP